MKGTLITGDLQKNTRTFKMKSPLTYHFTAGDYEIRKIDIKPIKIKEFTLKSKVSDIFGEAIKNRLHSADIHTISQLITKSSAELTLIRSLGKISLRKIQESLKENGLKLKDNK
jgi:DNA-directed RNA polymerase alpha subunit